MREKKKQGLISKNRSLGASGSCGNEISLTLSEIQTPVILACSQVSVYFINNLYAATSISL
jgi:hypothetical protein